MRPSPNGPKSGYKNNHTKAHRNTGLATKKPAGQTDYNGPKAHNDTHHQGPARAPTGEQVAKRVDRSASLSRHALLCLDCLKTDAGDDNRNPSFTGTQYPQNPRQNPIYFSDRTAQPDKKVGSTRGDLCSILA
ncbi:hypothetical protein Rs2_47592 [Raphanus sativus]|nr:hypothetical protein Rs2_47592 [Raphanus sativus]